MPNYVNQTNLAYFILQFNYVLRSFPILSLCLMIVVVLFAILVDLVVLVDLAVLVDLVVLAVLAVFVCLAVLVVLVVFVCLAVLFVLAAADSCAF